MTVMLNKFISISPSPNQAPGSQKKFQGLCPLEERKGRKERGGEGKVGPPNFETVVAPLLSGICYKLTKRF